MRRKERSRPACWGRGERNSTGNEHRCRYARFSLWKHHHEKRETEYSFL